MGRQDHWVVGGGMVEVLLPCPGPAAEDGMQRESAAAAGLGVWAWMPSAPAGSSSAKGPGTAAARCSQVLGGGAGQDHGDDNPVMPNPDPHRRMTDAVPDADAAVLEQAASAFESALLRHRPSLWARARQRPARPRATWCGPAGQALGSIEPAIAEGLRAAGLPWRRIDPRPGSGPRVAHAVGADPALPVWQVGPLATDASPPAAALDDGLDHALERTARWIHDQRLGGRWRQEALSVTDASGIEHARVERAAVRVLGVTTWAVHLCGYGRGPQGEPAQWLQQRALDKATDPGLWDTLMGGQCAAGESLAVSLERETWEEAGLRLPMLRALREAGRCRFERPVSDGWLVEHIDLFEAWVPDGVTPQNQDGEVERFERAGVQSLNERLDRGEVTLEAALMMARAVERRA